MYGQTRALTTENFSGATARSRVEGLPEATCGTIIDGHAFDLGKLHRG